MNESDMEGRKRRRGKRGTLIVVEGIDGSGKGVIVDYLGRRLRKHGTVFDARNFARRTGRLPAPTRWRDADAVLSAEPTYAEVGALIRNELIRSGTRYAASLISEAYAFDRFLHHALLIDPARAAGKVIVQERSLAGSLVYQPLLRGITRKWVAALPGNLHAARRPPDLMLIASVPPRTAMERLELRKKQDKTFFETLAFQQKVHRAYHAPWLKQFFARRGTTVVFLDMNRTIGEELRDVERIVCPYL